MNKLTKSNPFMICLQTVLITVTLTKCITIYNVINLADTASVFDDIPTSKLKYLTNLLSTIIKSLFINN